MQTIELSEGHSAEDTEMYYRALGSARNKRVALGGAGLSSFAEEPADYWYKSAGIGISTRGFKSTRLTRHAAK
jgi:hypothetical protein